MERRAEKRIVEYLLRTAERPTARLVVACRGKQVVADLERLAGERGVDLIRALRRAKIIKQSGKKTG